MTFFKPKTLVIIYSILLALILFSLLFLVIEGSERFTDFSFFYVYGIGFVAILFKLKKAREQMKIEASLGDKIAFTDTFHITTSGTIEFKRYLKYQLSLIMGNTLQTVVSTSIFLMVIVWSMYNAKEIDFVLIAVPIFVLIIFPVLLYRNIKKIYQSHKILNEPQQIEINNECVHIVTSHVDSKVKWSSFIKASDNKYFFILFQSEQLGIFIDKSFLTDEQINTLRTFINSLPIPVKFYK